MTLEDILESEELRQKEFPVVQREIFLAHAGVSPLPRRVARKIQEAAERSTLGDQEREEIWQEVEQTRVLASNLLQAEPEEIALLGPTALGLNLVAHGLDWRPGEEIIYYPGDYPSNVYPWRTLAQRGAVLIPLQPKVPGQIDPEMVFEALSPRTRLVALSSCHFLSGYLLDYRSIGEELRRRGILFCLDGIQSLGAAELDSRFFDFLSADSHKWLLGPLGAGIFFVKKERQDELFPLLVGAWNVQSPRFIAQSSLVFHPTARRYECGALYALGILGLKASLELLLSVGIEKIRNRLLQLHDFLASRLEQLGWEILSAKFPENRRSGIVSVSHPTHPLQPVFEQLKEQNVRVSLRWDSEAKPYLRFSPHFYNTEEELEKVLHILQHL
ncbi:aminotransferase class V-fold PLP-dependent enzyme [Candidatus Methylacidithermus pantelleriae]|uniref:Cysteine desulfurase n=1 Tax=Candidatus Methylacidithermus pantelleriae TaxID=2744239 RepID=A0A8J2FVK1_9BACT|nr:aminotransferase class V-fold PLP-dependent enzyme [Candidatus Methylacidithermus pantelleriae]CAF0693958.1 Cysteine desulfurase [Candidatus Methylacidithermus pantelleriae]